MWILSLTAALAGSEINIQSSAPCSIDVAGQTESMKSGRKAKFKVDEGSIPIAVGGSSWLLDLPNRVEVELLCDGASVRLTRAESMGNALANVAQAGMAVGAGAMAVSDAASATSQGLSDAQMVSNGQTPASGSSRTDVSLSMGPEGMKSSSSRTTAGAGGVTHESSSTSIGPDGVSRTTASGVVNGSGASFEETRRGVSIQLPGKKGVVVLRQVGGGGPLAAATGPGAGATSSPPVPEERPKEALYSESGKQRVDGVVREIINPVGTDGLFKFGLKLSAPDDFFVLLDPQAVKINADGQTANADATKTTVVKPGKSKATTLSFPGDHRVRQIDVAVQGVSRVALDGEALPSTAVSLGEGKSAAAGPLQCTVSKLKQGKKDVRASLSCTSTEWVVVLPAEVGVVAGGKRLENQDAKSPLLIQPGGKGKFDVVVDGGEDLQLDLSGAVRVATPVPVDFGTFRLKGQW